ncbi:hypothetical protein COO60DRAFT_1270809 [Scenedesmus sp. NREL 46B-D3]|nr:hypothetical protein COO60DRAFT_1270809 [Scenedesmus sp. NREL 46B-D3]
MQEYDAPDVAVGPPYSRQQQQQQYAAGGASGDATRVLFCSCKGETNTHKSGFKQLYRRLRSMYRPEKLDSQDDLCLEVLLGPGATAPTILVLGCPTQPFTAAEFDTLRAFLQAGGSLLVCMAEGGEASTNINYFLEEHGIAVNSDAVVRTAHYKYLHPKEALISDGVLNRALLSAAAGGGGKGSSKADNAPSLDDDAQLGQTGSGAAADGFAGKGLDFVYPYGCTLSVQPPAVPILSTGKISYPMQRPLGACWSSAEPGGGRLLVLGAAGLFDDAWLDKEDNSRLSDFVFRWLRPGSKVSLHAADAEDPDISSDLALLPDTETLADRPKPCLAEVQQLPRDWARLFDGQLYGLGMHHVPAAVALYGQLGVKKAPLCLIPPAFETPLPPLQPATFPPCPREPPPPALELFDLDDAFAGEQAQLSALVSKCKPGADDLEYFLLEAGQLAGLDVPPEQGAKGVLAELLHRIVQYKTAGVAGSPRGPDNAQYDGSMRGDFGSPALGRSGSLQRHSSSRSARAADFEL